jgi:hypothetical protein
VRLNNRGQFSIIAALLVAVILISTVIVTYSTIRNSSTSYQPQLLSAIDETNFAIKQIFGFTVGYYGSVLKITGNSSYARMLALNYLYSALVNIANVHPEWGTSFKVNESKTDLHICWFTKTSYSTGNLAVTYNLTGLGIYRITYQTSCKLSIQIIKTNSTTQACLNVTKDENEPLINLGKQNFKFYIYKYANSTWELINPRTEPIAFANGTYLVDIPSGVDPYSYVIQVEDQRGIIVAASSFSRYTITPTWQSQSAKGEDYVDSISNVDSSPDIGTHSNFTAEQNFDSIYDTLTEAKMDIRVKTGTFTKASSFGPSWQIISGVGFQPKAVIFWWTRQTSYGESAAISIGYGFATNDGGSYQNYGVAFSSDDGSGTSNTGRRRSETYSIIILSNGNPTMSAQASVTSFNNDGFTLYWQTNEARADIIHYIALGGVDLTNAKAGSFGLTAASGTQDVTGVGFQPDFAMFLWTFTETADTSQSNAEIGLGFAVSSTKRGAIVADSQDGNSTMDTWQQQRTDSCILLLNPSSGAQDAVVDFNQFLADGFRLSKSDAPAASTPIFYLALKGGYYDVGSFNSTTSTGTQDITSVGFRPRLVMLATQGRSASAARGGTAELAFGAATSSTDRGATWFEDPTGLADSDNEMETLNTKIIQWRDRTAANTFTLRGSADFVSFLSNGFRVSWSNFETSGRQIIYVAIGADENYKLDLEAHWTNVNYNGTIEELRIYANSTATENLRVDVWHGGSWNNVITALTNGWNNVSVSAYLDSSTFTIRFKGSNEISDATQDSWRIDAAMLYIWPLQDLYASVQNVTTVTEVLQNGTMRWLGQNLQLTTQAKPIPPIPVKAIHVNQTISGLNREVPFQIEDWASDYKIPLGLTSNASVFGNKNMLVFLINSKVSKVTIWWEGSDTATQTPNAYINKYFTMSSTSTSRTLNNTILSLKVDWSDGTIRAISSMKSVTTTAVLMRINTKVARWGSSAPAIAIQNGPVRAVLHHEVEWGSGSSYEIPNCPNVYAHIVLTLPANATYYTYQLRLMFIESQQSRTISEICPIKITTSISSLQTENGISGGFPIVQSGTGTFYNSSSIWQHHWSQFISTTRGAGIMFTDAANKMLYAFDTSTSKTGALKVDSTATKIELLPITMSSRSFTSAKDIIWYGAVVNFDGTTPIYDSSTKSGLWITVEYPPTIAVTTQS